MNTSEDKNLQQILQQWKLSESLPPRFPERVWNRIESTGTQLNSPLTNIIRTWFEALIPKPAFAVSCATVLLTAALTAGYLQGEAHIQRVRSELAQRYVQSLDPYRKTYMP